MIVYLAGGMRTDWRKELKKTLGRKAKDIKFISPNYLNTREQEYTAWDLYAIRKSDWIFVYLEADNPGIGLNVEIGYAKALGKGIIFVCDSNHPQFNYFGLARACSDIVYYSLKDGIRFLTTLPKSV